MKGSAILNIENDVKYCFVSSAITYLHPCNNSHPNRVSKYKQSFNELNIEGFDFTNGFKCSDVHKFEKLNKLSINIFELNLCQDQNKWKHKLIPNEVSKNESDRVIGFIIYKHLYALIKELTVFLGEHHKIFICRRCLNSYTSEKMLLLHEPKCQNNLIITLRTTNESHIQWKNQFHKNPLYFTIYADLELIMKYIILV